MNKVYLMDCVEGMKGTPDKYYDLAVVDTHAGSMSSVISAMKNEMQITAYEIDSDYFNAGKKRIETYLQQGDMFNQPKIEFIS